MHDFPIQVEMVAILTFMEAHHIMMVLMYTHVRHVFIPFGHKHSIGLLTYFK